MENQAVPQKISEDRMFRPREIAGMFDCTTQTVYKLASTGKLHSIRVGPSSLRIPQSAVDDYLTARLGAKKGQD